MGGAQPAESCSAVPDSKTVFSQAHGGIVGVGLVQGLELDDPCGFLPSQDSVTVIPLWGTRMFYSA